VTELSFLIDLLLNHKLPKPTREAVTARLRDVEAGYAAAPPAPARLVAHAAFANQAPSMQAIMARNPDLVPPDPQPVAVIAQTPAAVQAMNSRNQAIAQAISGKTVEGQTRPRKF
jgi:hypothetical protein